ncbi:hypothetical protein OS493_005106 [Desmophyllum pertusum]|uniref:Uncharacterized protein n=1 Tax=Desmophyllum pertusum TaxID=174260 RepID=A0A9X0CUK1_9CNID|nr:hypothetical protein OS493_005106 [Desmophyllum pertusum]
MLYIPVVEISLADLLYTQLVRYGKIVRKKVEEFSSSREAELSTLRDVRIVVIDDETISFFREEFVKRYTSQYTSSSPTDLTALERPSGEKQESSPILNSSVKQPSISSADTVVNPSNFSEIHVAKLPYGRGRGILLANLSRRRNGEVVSKASGSTQLLTKGETKNTEARRGRDITYATTNTPPGLTVTEGKERQDSKQIEQGSDANNNWRQVQSDVGQMRQALDKEKCVRNIRKQELREKETFLINTLQHTLCEEQQVRTRVEEELIQARIACNELEVRSGNELAQMRQTLNNEIRLRNNREQELREKGESIDELQKTLVVEQQARTRVGEELTQARSACTVLERGLQDERQVKENAIREQRRLLEEERQQKSDLEDRLRTLQLQMEQERNRYEQNEMLSRQSLQQELRVNENAIREQRRLLEEERQQKTDLEDRLRTLQLQMEEERNRYASTERELHQSYLRLRRH